MPQEERLPRSRPFQVSSAGQQEVPVERRPLLNLSPRKLTAAWWAVNLQTFNVYFKRNPARPRARRGFHARRTATALQPACNHRR